LLLADCQTCDEYGPFLHLPTCTRCCFRCLREHSRLWMLPISKAKACFELTDSQLKRLPIMRSIPGSYSVSYQISRKRPLRLLCVGPAKQLALLENGDFEARLESKYHNRLVSQKDYYKYKSFMAELDDVPRSSMSNIGNDEYCGMASIPFPHLTAEHAIDEGYWCLGCELTSQTWRDDGLTPAELSRLNPITTLRRRDYQLRELAQRARSSAGLLEHLPHCIRGRNVEELESKLSRWKLF